MLTVSSLTFKCAVNFHGLPTIALSESFLTVVKLQKMNGETVNRVAEIWLEGCLLLDDEKYSRLVNGLQHV
jgi:hypothetical protein